MSVFKATWKRVPFNEHAAALQRSSQSLAVVQDHAYIFGGEQKPRTPVDDVLYEVDLQSGKVATYPGGPEARVGAGLAPLESENALLLWGGRGGKAMTPLSADIQRFDLSSKKWTSHTSSQSDAPQERSFHTLVAAGETVYLHAGCPAKGRLPSLSAYQNGKWTAKADAPEPARGGTALAVLHDGSLARFGGFAGYELGGPLELFEPSSNSWSAAKVDTSKEPSKRSVHGFVGLNKPIQRDGKELVALLVYGEADPAPAELGHDGAGQFHNDVWALLKQGDTFSWAQLDATNGPSPRGWAGFAPWHRTDGSTAVVVHGGLNEKNERLGDEGLWILTVE